MYGNQAGETQKETGQRFTRNCDHCGDQITSNGVEVHQKMFCCANCAEQANEIQWREIY